MKGIMMESGITCLQWGSHQGKNCHLFADTWILLQLKFKISTSLMLS